MSRAKADGSQVTSNDVAVIDYSHMSDGYICASYTGTCPKVKLRITGPDTVVYTYDLHGGGYETFPLSSGNGYYDVTIYENISGTNYATCLYADLDVQITDEFSPFLYPNQYVNFTADSKVVAKGQELAEGASSDLEVITRIYDYITGNITYDYDKASDPPTGYTSDVDAIWIPAPVSVWTMPPLWRACSEASGSLPDWKSVTRRMPTMPGSVYILRIQAG